MNVHACMKCNSQVAFADDLCMLMQDLWRGLLSVYSFCLLLRLATGMELNIRKTCIVPLWPRADLAAAPRRLTSMIPTWAAIECDTAYKYLGVYISPAAHKRRWDVVARLLVAVAADVAAVSSSWSHAGFLYSTYCVSRLAYRLQLSLQSQEVKTAWGGP
jgi:hypothetical protein